MALEQLPKGTQLLTLHTTTTGWTEAEAKELQHLLGDLLYKAPTFVLRWLQMGIAWRPGGRRNLVQIYAKNVLAAPDWTAKKTELRWAKDHLSRASFWRLGQLVAKDADAADAYKMLRWTRT